MIYNFQPVCVRDDVYLCSLDMMIKPLKETDASKDIKGVPLTLVINGATGEVGNAAYGLAMIMGKKVQDENETEKPQVYGKYNDAMYSKPLILTLAKQLNQELGTTAEDLKDKGCQTKELKPKDQSELHGSPIHFSFQRRPKREIFRNTLDPIPEAQVFSPVVFHSPKPVLHRLKAMAA